MLYNQYCIKTLFPENCQENMTAIIFERASNGLLSAGTYIAYPTMCEMLDIFEQEH